MSLIIEATACRRSERSPVVNFSRSVSRNPLWTLLAMAIGLVAGCAVAFDFQITWSAGALAVFFYFLAATILFQRLGWTRSAEAFHAAVQLLLTCVLAGMLSALLASTNFPYRDAELAAIDRWLFGVEWADMAKNMLAVLPSWPLNFAYSSIDWTPAVAIIALAASAQHARLKTFLFAWALSLFATIIVFPFVPAVGGYLHFGIQAAEVPDVRVPVAWRHIATLEPLRSGEVRQIATSRIEGIVTFPSFHAAASILLGWAFLRTQYLRWPALILNAGMLVSSIPIGAHYIVDLLVGIAIAVGALWVGQRARRVRDSSPDLRCHAVQP